MCNVRTIAEKFNAERNEDRHECVFRKSAEGASVAQRRRKKSEIRESIGVEPKQRRRKRLRLRGSSLIAIMRLNFNKVDTNSTKFPLI